MGNEIKNSSVLSKSNAGLDTMMQSMTGQQPAQPVGSAIVSKGEGRFTYKRFTITPTGLEAPANVQRWEWEDAGKHIKSLHGSLSWVIGDWALIAYEQWKLSYEQIAKDFDYELSTIEAYTSICKAIPGMIRNHTVSFAHHRQLTGFEVEAIKGLLEYILLHNLTTNALKVEIAALRRAPNRNYYEIVRWANENKLKLSEQPELQLPQLEDRVKLPGFSSKRELKGARTALTRISNWQEGKKNLTPQEALEDLDFLVKFFTVQRDSLSDQIPDRDNSTYQE